jgi:hypothetical protein
MRAAAASLPARWDLPECTRAQINFREEIVVVSASVVRP